MVIKQRKVRRSTRFSPRYVKRPSRRSELVVSGLTTAVVKGFLALFLMLAAYKSYQVMSLKGSSLSILKRLTLPVLLITGAMLVLRGSVRQLIDLAKKKGNSSGPG